MADRSLVERNAQEFGQHVRQGGWRLGYLVATSVEKGSGDGVNIAYREGVSIETPSKVSARKFSEQSGVSATKVLRYLEAWNRAADDLGIEHADDMHPGYTCDWLTEEWVEQHPWGKYYSTVNKNPEAPADGTPPTQEAQATAFEHQVTTNPDFARQAAETLRKVAPETQQVTPEQVREAVRTNPEVEKVAKEEAFQRMRERARENSPAFDPTVPHEDDRPQPRTAQDQADDALELLRYLRRAEKELTEAMYAAQRVGSTWTQDISVTVNIRELCDMIDNALISGGMDAQLAALMEGME